MRESIFDFWAQMPRGTRIHPRDEAVLRRNEGQHGLNLDCLPCSFNGPLRVAKLVLLFLNPGLNDSDVAHAASEGGKDLYFRQWSGHAPLPTSKEHETAATWASKILRQFDMPHAAVASTCSIVNLMPYHSEAFADWGLLPALPSSRATIGWAQDCLFERARKRELVVVCLRSARQWGLRRGMTPEGYLFAPNVGRSGHVPKVGEERDSVIAAIQDVTGR